MERSSPFKCTIYHISELSRFCKVGKTAGSMKEPKGKKKARIYIVCRIAYNRINTWC